MSDSDQEILEAINQGSFNFAQSQLSKKLKKFPNKSYYWALNNYYLYSVGKINESLTQCEDLLKKVPSDPNTLDLLYDLYYKLGQPTLANQCYENAVKKYPNNQIIFDWFKKSINSNDIKSIQKSISQVQKFNKLDPLYTYWNSFAYYLLSDSIKDDEAHLKEKSLYQSLSLKILSTLESKPSTNQQLFILIKLHEQRNELDKVVEIIKDTLTTNPQEVDLELLIIYLNSLSSLSMWQELYDKTYDLIFNEKFNDFNTWKYLIKANHNLALPKTTLSEKINHNLGSRNSYLALIELDKTYSIDLKESITSYFNKFNDKKCCFHDLLLYINQENKSTLYELFDDITTNDHAKINYEQFKLYFGDSQQAIIPQNANLEWNDMKLIKSIQNFQKDQSIKSIVHEIITLESLLTKDSENYKLRLWLINYYTLINCSELSLYHYKNLKIKMIQHDTLSYKIINNLSPTLSNLNQLIEIYKFYYTAEYEVDENIRKAFEKGVFNKLPDFIKFSNRLKNSISKKLVILEILKISRILNNEYYSYFSKLISNEKFDYINDSLTKVSDNRDFKTDVQFTGSIINDVQSTSLPQLIKDKEYVSLNYLKELIIIERDQSSISKLLKNFNKILSNAKINDQLTKFEVWLFKIYLNVFKVLKIDDCKEKDAIQNYLTKNLKFDKINTLYLKDHEHFDWVLNHVIVNLYDLIKIVNKLNKKDSTNFNHSINQIISHLFRSLSTYKPEFRSSSSYINKDELNFDSEFINDKVDEIDSYFKSSRFLLK